MLFFLLNVFFFTLGILAHLLTMVIEPQYLAFRFGDCTPQSSSSNVRFEPGSLQSLPNLWGIVQALPKKATQKKQHLPSQKRTKCREVLLEKPLPLITTCQRRTKNDRTLDYRPVNSHSPLENPYR